MARALTVHADGAHPFVPYALRLAELAGGVHFAPVGEHDRAATVDVYYGSDHRRPCQIRIPYVPRYAVETVPSIPGRRAVEDAGDRDVAFPFDLFAALRFWLADEGNAVGQVAYDKHGRIIADRSAQARAGVVDVPVVNAYLGLFRRWIERRTGLRTKSAIPPGKRCVVVLTHDVDNPVDPTDPRHRVWLASRDVRRGRPRRALRHLRMAARIASRPVTPRPAARLFRDILRAEERVGVRSTFFFAPISTFSPLGHPFDVNYDLEAPRFRRVTRELVARGAEVALHVSYGAMADVRRIALERSRLEAVSGSAVIGCRHHYLHTSQPVWPSLEAHSAAGLRYDSSVAFQDEPGFRLGTALAAPLWNPRSNSVIRAIQVPLMAMDGHFYHYSHQSLEKTMEQVARLVDNLKRYEGVAALDWHEYTSSPESRTHGDWGMGYRAILDLLASDPEVSLMSCSEAIELSSTEDREGSAESGTGGESEPGRRGDWTARAADGRM
jgi:hypothetical protein